MWVERHSCHYWEILLLKTRTVRNRPSRLMYWWTQFTAISITLTWEVIWHIFLYKLLVWDCVSLTNVSETLFFSNSPMKRNHKPTDRAAPPPKKNINIIIFGKVSEAKARYTADLISMFLLKGISGWTSGGLSFLSLYGQSKYSDTSANEDNSFRNHIR